MPPPFGSAASAVISWPSIFRWIVSITRSRTVSLYFVGSNASFDVWSMSCFASLSSLSLDFAVGNWHFSRRTELVGVVELLHHEAAVVRAKKNEMLLSARCVLAERGLPALLERRGQQTIRAIAALVRAEIVDFVDIFAVHRRERHELDDVDRARRLFLERLELVGREHDVLVLRELVALDRVVARDDFVVVLRADVLLLEPAVALLVEHVERHARLRFSDE